MRRVFANVFVAFFLITAAQAASQKEWDNCRATDLDRRIAGCSRIAENRSESTRERVEAYNNRGYAHYSKRDDDRAIADFDQAIRLDPRYSHAYVNRGLAYGRKGDSDRAVADYDEAIRLNPTHVHAYIFRANVFADKREYARAIADFNHAIQLDPRSVFAYNNRGMAHYRKGDFDSAFADFDQVIRLDQKYASGYNNRGLAHQARRDHDRAIADFSEAIRFDSKHTNAYLNRAISYAEKKDFERALADYDAAIRIDPKNPKLYVNRGIVRSQTNDFDKAFADFDRAIELDPTLTASYSNRGVAWLNKGDLIRAAADFRTALALPPKGDKAEGSQRTAREELAKISPGENPAPSQLAAKPTIPTQGGRRVALVMGNGAYVNATALPNPVNDARAVSRTLREIGFEVSDGFNLDRNSMEKLVRDFLGKADGAQVALLYYAGHGMQVDSKNYLIPVDAKLSAPSDLNFETVSIDTILANLDDQARANIVILDACRDNPLTRRFASRAGATRSASVGAGLAAYSTVGTGTLIAYATAPGQIALDGEGANSPFTTALIKHMRDPAVEVRQMLTRVRSDVAQVTRYKQVPWDNSSLLGDVYLARK